MSEPTTLRALAALPQSPVSLSESTLIMIDCQNTYTRGVMELVDLFAVAVPAGSGIPA